MRFAQAVSGSHLHVRTLFKYLHNGWTDCDEISCVVKDGSIRFAFCTGHEPVTYARAHARTLSSSYLENGSTDCADIWCVVGDQLALSFVQAVSGRASLRVRTCTLYLYFAIKAGRIVL